MPLSEEEARVLEQLERSLTAEDPEFASALRGSKIADQYRRIAVISAIAFVAGIVLLLVGAMKTFTWLGVLGFLLMLAGAYWFAQSWRRGVLPGQVDDSTRPAKSTRKNGTFVERMEQRWQDRRDQGQF